MYIRILGDTSQAGLRGVENLATSVIHREISDQSEKCITKLDKLKNRFSDCQIKFNSLIEQLNYMNEHADKMKVKDQLNQLHGNLEQLLYNDKLIVLWSMSCNQVKKRQRRQRSN